MANLDKDELELVKMMKISKIMDKRLSPLEIRTLLSLIQDFSNDRIRKSEFTKSFRLFFKKKKDAEDEARKARQDDDAGGQDTDLEEDHLRGDCLEVRAKVDENPREDVSEERRSEKYVRNGFDKKRRILQSDRTDEMSLERRRASRRLERVTPSHRLIPEEEKCQAASEHMYEADMLMEALRSAEESVERVRRGEMSMEDLGAKFDRCIEVMYCRDTSDIVRDMQKKALPLILRRLNQKVDELIDAQESWKPDWKQVFEENTAKQREASTVQGHRKKLVDSD